VALCQDDSAATAGYPAATAAFDAAIATHLSASAGRPPPPSVRPAQRAAPAPTPAAARRGSCQPSRKPRQLAARAGRRKPLRTEPTLGPPPQPARVYARRAGGGGAVAGSGGGGKAPKPSGAAGPTAAQAGLDSGLGVFPRGGWRRRRGLPAHLSGAFAASIARFRVAVAQGVARARPSHTARAAGRHLRQACGLAPPPPPPPPPPGAPPPTPTPPTTVRQATTSTRAAGARSRPRRPRCR
jgi:hypothetical protein